MPINLHRLVENSFHTNCRKKEQPWHQLQRVNKAFVPLHCLFQIALNCFVFNIVVMVMVMVIGFHYFISQGGVMSTFIHGIAPFTFSPQDDFDEGHNQWLLTMAPWSQPWPNVTLIWTLYCHYQRNGWQTSEPGLGLRLDGVGGVREWGFTGWKIEVGRSWRSWGSEGRVAPTVRLTRQPETNRETWITLVWTTQQYSEGGLPARSPPPWTRAQFWS